MGRGDEAGTVRSIETPSLFPEDLDQDAWRIRQDRDAEVQSPLGLSYPFMSSHVLLSACQPLETAKEDVLTYKRDGTEQNRMKRGVFTSNLVTSLYDAWSEANSQPTYTALMGDLSWDSRYLQRPACEGTNKNRYLFSTAHDPDPLLMFKLIFTESGYRADAGWIHGAVGTQGAEGTNTTQPTEFTVCPGGGTLVTQSVGWNYCELAYKDGHRFDIPKEGTATISVGRCLNVYFEPGLPEVPDIGKHFTIVAERSEAHVVVQRDADQESLHFQGVDKRVPEHSRAKSVRSFLPQVLVPTLDKIAYFNFHLHREARYRLLHQYVELSLVPLKEIPGGVRIPIDNDAMTLHDGLDAAVTELEPYYGLTLKSTFHQNLYPYLFHFRPRDCAITVRNTYSMLHTLAEVVMQSFYVPPTPHTPPLPAGKPGKPAEVSIVGFGAEGGDAIKFSLDNGREDTTFFKLFLSSSHVNMKITEQRVDGLRGPGLIHLRPGYIWDAWTFPISTRPS
jgi:hypothetical protein